MTFRQRVLGGGEIESDKLVIEIELKRLNIKFEINTIFFKDLAFKKFYIYRLDP